MPITVEASGSFGNTVRFLQKMARGEIQQILNKYGPIGVAALSAATPTDTGETAHSWTYEITRAKGGYSIVWKNTHVVNGANIAILLQYGHGTGTGGYIQGRDYINPAMRPIFDQMLADIRRAVTK